MQIRSHILKMRAVKHIKQIVSSFWGATLYSDFICDKKVNVAKFPYGVDHTPVVIG